MNLLQVSNLTLTPASRSSRVIMLKRLYISLIIISRTSKYENNL